MTWMILRSHVSEPEPEPESESLYCHCNIGTVSAVSEKYI